MSLWWMAGPLLLYAACWCAYSIGHYRGFMKGRKLERLDWLDKQAVDDYRSQQQEERMNEPETITTTSEAYRLHCACMAWLHAPQTSTAEEYDAMVREIRDAAANALGERTELEALRKLHTQQMACIQVIARGDELSIPADFPAAEDVRNLLFKLRAPVPERTP